MSNGRLISSVNRRRFLQTGAVGLGGQALCDTSRTAARQQPVFPNYMRNKQGLQIIKMQITNNTGPKGFLWFDGITDAAPSGVYLSDYRETSRPTSPNVGQVSFKLFHCPFRTTIDQSGSPARLVRAFCSRSVSHRVCEGAPPPIHEFNSEVPDWFVEIVARLPAKDPSDRFQSAGDVAALLERHLARVQDPSLPPIAHDWVMRPAPAAWSSRLCRAAASRWTVAFFAVILAAAMTFELTRFSTPPPSTGPGVTSGDTLGSGWSDQRSSRSGVRT